MPQTLRCRKKMDERDAFILIRRFSKWSAAALLLAAAPAALAQTGMNPSLPPPPPAPPMALPVVPHGPAPAGVAAVVNGQKIYRFQVANQALNVYGPQILNTMVLIELINQEAVKQHIVITPAQLDAQLADIRRQAALRIPGGLDTVLAQRHQTLAAFKAQLLPQMQAEALVGKTLPPAPMVLRYHLRHLLVMTTSATPAAAPGAKPPHTDAEALAIIAKAQADLKAGKSFAEVANTYTEDPTGKGKGGDLGIIDGSVQFDPAFKAAALALKPGQVTPTPVKSQFGYHLIKMESTSADPLPSDRALYTAAAAAARRQQVLQAIPAYVQALRAKAKVVDYLSTP